MRMLENRKKKTASTEQIDRPAEVASPTRRSPITGDSDEQLLSTHGRTFHFAARFLSPKFRHPVVTLYAFFRDLLLSWPNILSLQRSSSTFLMEWLLIWSHRRYMTSVKCTATALALQGQWAGL